jgi:branched-chain amino acid transport system substrate-binding protein
MIRFSRLLFVIVIVLVLSGGLHVAAQEAGTLKVGAIFSVTGGATLLGDPEKKTVHMVVDKVNETVGVNRHRLDVLIEDDQTDATKAVTAAQKLIYSDKVLVIVGPSTSGASLAIKSICEKARIPMVSCAAAEAIVTPVEEFRFIFKTPQKDSHVVMKIIDQMSKMGITRIAILSETLPFGQLGRKLLQEHAQAKGIEVVGDETYGPADPDLNPLLQKIAAAQPQAVVNWSIVPAQSAVPKEMKRLGMTMPLFQSHGFGNPKYIEAAGEAAEGIIFPAGRLLIVESLQRNHPQLRSLWTYKHDYENSFNSSASTFGGHAYDAIRLAIGAMRDKQITSQMDVARARALIRDGIEETKDWPGTAGRFNMSSTDHNGLDKDDSLEMIYVDKGGRLIPLSKKGQ